ncbi:hypothetical protein MST22_05850 [Virgibacillus halodenitrificans]|uniref:hypothetical protein n=1 Tax=Virgibacillus halodenitrificans TaxID=1482 RepID=UPI001FB336F4|nr:hypothetical protein [Virgibacillus halodenitrificans]MCJ0930673.1 hypothetical protein [Virgibacillus halodenitrificans]
MKKLYRNILIYTIAVILLVLVLELSGINTAIIPAVIEWATAFILPWIGLYWLIRLVKSLEKR